MDLAFHHKKFENKLLKKTLIISNYFNDLGNKADINFSATLTETLNLPQKSKRLLGKILFANKQQLTRNIGEK